MTDTTSDGANSSGENAESKESSITDVVGDLLKALRSHSRRVSRAKNLLAKVKSKKPDAADYAVWREVYQGLEGYEIGVAELDEQREMFVERVGRGLERLRVKARMRFLQKLDMLAEQADVAVEKLSEAPLVLYLKPLTFEIDFDAGHARMLYGHELIEEVPLEARKLLDARKSALARLEEQSLASDDFFDLLHDAYRTVLVADHAKPGERVELVDVLVPLAMLRAERSAWRKKGPDALEPFSRPLLAWQLAALRRDGVLERNGVRLELGAATGGSTRDKTNVLYVPVGAKSGQYYGSLRFGA